MSTNTEAIIISRFAIYWLKTKKGGEIKKYLYLPDNIYRLFCKCFSVGVCCQFQTYTNQVGSNLNIHYYQECSNLNIHYYQKCSDLNINYYQECSNINIHYYQDCSNLNTHYYLDCSKRNIHYYLDCSHLNIHYY